jgi:uncharacterized membrane protein HdeD (DUF308 family)
MSAYAQTKPPVVARILWWLVLIEGIAALLLGLLLLASPVRATAFLVQILGIYWLARGLFYTTNIFIDHAMWGWKLIAGIVGIMTGVLILQHPLGSTVIVPKMLVYIVGLSGLFLGLVGLLQAARGGGWVAGALGVLSIIFGLALLLNPFLASLTMPWILGLLSLAGGIMAIFGAFGLRKLQKGSPRPARAAPTPAMQMRVGIVAPGPVTSADAVETGAVAAGGATVGAAAETPTPEAPVAAEVASVMHETTESEVEAPAAEQEFSQPVPQAATEAKSAVDLVARKITEDSEHVESTGPLQLKVKGSRHLHPQRLAGVRADPQRQGGDRRAHRHQR